MTTRENLSRIFRKTYLSLLFILIVSIIIFIIISYYHFYVNRIIPKYDQSYLYNKTDIVEDKIHNVLRNDFIFINTLSLLFKNLFFIILLFSSLCFSFFINQNDLINSDGGQNLFSQIVSRGLYIIIFFNIIYYFSLDFLNKPIQKKIESIKNDTTISINLLKKGNEEYFKKNYIDSLNYYINYINLIENDDIIKDRIREINNTIKGAEFDKNKKNAELEKKNNEYKDVTSTITEYNKLAKIYYEKKDYASALYYYKYVAETRGSERADALKKIQSIKQILNYQKNLNESTNVIDTNKLDENLKKIYVLKERADNYFNKNDYQKAYFIYNDILEINQNLRDIADKKQLSLSKLKETAGEISEFNLARFYPKQYDFIFFIGPNDFLHIEEISKFFNYFYCYNIRIYNINNDFKVNYIIESKYGITKSDNKISLYTFSQSNRNEEYYPSIIVNNKRQRYDKIFIEIPVSLNNLFEFSYNYEKTLNTSIISLFSLRKISANKNSKNKNDNYSIGLNKHLIETAILDKVSRLFLFFAINLIMISIAWRFRSTYINKFPIIFYLFLLIIPVFIYYFINFILSSITLIISVLLLIINFNILLIFCIVINIIIVLISIFLIASCRS
ncbi:MAG: hypothetical protein JXB50_03835 [Spirochaetes bacterium]|nr:hypothetical protein [Spirochaetota bacterium]